MNQVTLSGFIGGDPKIVKKENFSVARLSIATKSYRNKENVTDWHEVEAFNQNADYIEKYLHKGDFVVISGYLTTTAFTDKSGQERKTYGVKLVTIEANTQSRQQSAPATPQSRQQQNPPQQPYQSQPSQDYPDDPMPF
jgi:single-strand DNA-binding protein